LGKTYIVKSEIDTLNLEPLNIQKPQGIGPLEHKDTAGLFVPHSVKTSVVMINTLDFKPDSPLMKLAEDMFKNGLDIVQTASSSKTSGLKPQPTFVFENDKLVYKGFDSEFISGLNWDYIGIQNQIENKYKKKTTYATQLRKQLLNNLKVLFSSEDRQNTEQKYHDLTNLRTKKAKEALLEKLGLSGEKNYELIKTRLIDAFKNKSITRNEIEGIAIALSDPDIKMFDTLITKPKIENIIFSFFRSDVINKKVRGDMFIQMSNAGTGIDLNTYIATDGKTIAAECAIPLPSEWYSWVVKEFGSLENFNREIRKPNQKIIDPELLEFPANRIPCQAPNLIDVFKVKQFLHPFTGNKIILPEEHSTKTGSDFDVDKLLSYLNNAYIANGKINSIQYPSSLTEDYLKTEWSRLAGNKEYAEVLSELKDRSLDIEAWKNNFESVGSIEDLFTSVSINDAQIASVLSRRSIDAINFLQYLNSVDTTLTREEFVDKWLGKNVEEYVSFEHIDNELHRITKEIVLHKNYFNQLMQPTDKSADIVKDEILKYREAPTTKFSNLITFSHNLDKTRNARVAGAGIGVVANQQSSHVLTQQFPLRINAPVINKFFPSETRFYIGQSLKTKEGHDISDIQSGMLTGFIDMENNDFILYSNIYGNMLSVFNYLLRVSPEGSPSPSFKHLIKLFSQAIVKEYQNDLASSAGLFYDVKGFADKKVGIVRKLFFATGYKGITETVIRNKELTQRTVPLYTLVDRSLKGDRDAQATISAYLEKAPNLNKEFFDNLESKLENQGYILDLLLYYEEHARYLSRLEQVSRPDAAFQKNRSEIRLMDAFKTDLFESGYFDSNDLERMFNETFIKEFDTTRQTAKEAYSEFFLTDNPYLNKKFNELAQRLVTQKKSTEDMESSLIVTENYFIGYIINKMISAPDYYHNLFTSDNNLSKQVYQLQNSDTKVKNNPVIKALYPILNPENKKQRRSLGFDYIQFHNAKMDVFKTDAMVDALMELYEIPETKEIAKNIVLHSIITAGLQYTPTSYQNLIPNEIYFTIVKPAIEEYLAKYINSQEVTDKVWQQFMWELRANRPMDSKVVTTTSFKFESGKNKPTYVHNGYKHKAFEGISDELVSIYGNKADFGLLKVLPAPSEDGEVYCGMLLKRGKVLIPALWKYTGLDTNDGSPIYVRIPTEGEQNKLFEVQNTRINSPEEITSEFNEVVDVIAYTQDTTELAENELQNRFETPQTLTNELKPNNEEQVNNSNEFTKDNRTIETEFQLTQGQDIALRTLLDFTNSQDKAITLQGPAGTGKTAVIGYLQKYLGGSTKIIYMAPTHAATAELAFATAKIGNKDLPMTVASSFRIAVDPDTNQKQATMTKKLSDKIGYGQNIIVVDEVSMLPNKDLDLMLAALEKRSNIKVIFMGDKLQIPEVDTNNPEIKQVSKTFTQFNQVYLTEVKRTDSPAILKVLTNLRNNTNSLIPEVENTAQIKFVDDNDFDKLIVETFKKDPENSVLISYTNAGVEGSNQKIRNVLGRSGDLVKEDIIVGYLGYSSKQIEKQNIANSIRYTVQLVTKKGSSYQIVATSEKLKNLEKQGISKVKEVASTEYLQLSESDSFKFDALTDQDFDNNNNRVSAYFRKLHTAKQAAKANPRLWPDFYNAQSAVSKFFEDINLGGTYIYNPSTDKMEIYNYSLHRGLDSDLKVEKGIDFGHAITVHKSQGTTVKNVFYDTATLPKGTGSKLYEGDNLIGTEKHSLNYVGMSRASQLLVIKKSDPTLFYPAQDIQSNYSKEKVIEVVNSEVFENQLREFLVQFGFETKELEDLTEATGLDILGATDFLEKVIFVQRDNLDQAYSKEAAYVIFNLLGRKNLLRKDLIASIHLIDNYESLKSKYINSKLTDYKIRELIAVDYLQSKLIEAHHEVLETDKEYQLRINGERNREKNEQRMDLIKLKALIKKYPEDAKKALE